MKLDEKTIDRLVAQLRGDYTTMDMAIVRMTDGIAARVGNIAPGDYIVAADAYSYTIARVQPDLSLDHWEEY